MCIATMYYNLEINPINYALSNVICGCLNISRLILVILIGICYFHLYNKFCLLYDSFIDDKGIC